MQEGFPYTDETLERLELSLSLDRLSTYSALVKGDRVKALQLYLLNTELSASLYGPLQALEVVIRNAMHRKLTKLYGTDWYDHPKCHLEFQQRQKVQEAKDILARDRKPVIPPQIVANLSFGFWVGLIGNKYENFWRPHLYSAFPHVSHPIRRKDIHGLLNKIKRLRNRIAHHEPIIERNIEEEYSLILKAIGWVCPATSEWVRYHTSIPSNN